MKIMRCTPIFVVDEILQDLEFWEKKLGFEKKVEVPFEDGIGFILLEKDEVEVMLQSRKSILADLPQLVQDWPHPFTIQYIDVDSLDEVLKSLRGVKLLVEPRETFYGTREIALRDAAGFPIVFAQKIS